MLVFWPPSIFVFCLVACLRHSMAGNAQGERINGALVLSGIALRLALFSFPVVADALSSRIELATPVTSYKRCKNKRAKNLARWMLMRIGSSKRRRVSIR